MRYSSVLASLFVAGVIGTPVADPAIDYEIKYVEITTTITVSGNPTPEAQPNFDFGPEYAPEPIYIPNVYMPEQDSQPDQQPEPQPEQDFEEVTQDEAPQQDSSRPSAGSPDGDFQSKVLHHHDIHRRNHSAEPLIWSDALASFALQTAQTCVYDHDT